VLERVAPLPRNRPVQFNMPAIETAEDLGEAMGAILRAAADGELTPGEAWLKRDATRRGAALHLRGCWRDDGSDNRAAIPQWRCRDCDRDR
jgi:hypothetical protein